MNVLLRTITVSLKRAGVAEFPAAFTEKLALIARVDAANFTPYDASRLTSAVVAALLAEKNPATDPAVIKAFAEDQLSEARNWDITLKNWRDLEMSALLREWAPSLIAEWAGHVCTAGKRLSDAAGSLNLGASLDEQSKSVLRAGKAASAWQEAYLAVGVIDNVVAAQSALIALCESRTHADKALLACPEMTAADCGNLPDERGRSNVPQTDAWTLTCEGHKITGTDYEGYKAARSRNDAEVAAGRKAQATRQERGRVMSSW